MSVEAEIKISLAKYSPDISAQLCDARSRLQALFPRGFELVYDNYNALVFCFGPTDRAASAILSLAGYPRWITLFFAKGKMLEDPTGILQGTGSIIRSVRLGSPADLDRPDVKSLIAQATQPHLAALEIARSLQTVIKSVSSKQRERRPPSTSSNSTNLASKKTRK